MSLNGKGKSLCRGCRRVRNNTPCPSARPPFGDPQVRPAVSLVDAGMFSLPLPLLSSVRGRCSCALSRSYTHSSAYEVYAKSDPVPPQLPFRSHSSTPLPVSAAPQLIFASSAPRRRPQGRSWASSGLGSLWRLSQHAPNGKRGKYKNSRPEVAEVLAAAGCFDWA